MKTKKPYADLLPPLSTSEFEALAASIKATGVRDPVILDEDGNVLDGHHRLKINPGAPSRIIKGLSESEKQAFVFASNFTRRNLSGDQKKDRLAVMKKIAVALREENAKKNTQKRVATLLGVDRSTVAKWFDSKVTPNVNSHIRRNHDARVKIPTAAHADIVERTEVGDSQEQVAADYGVGQQQISRIVARATKAKEAASKRKATPLPKGTYDVILADPPWKYDFAETDNRKVENQYPTMIAEKIAALKPPAAKNCVLFLWATSPKLREALAVIDGWGFTYKTHAVWDKQKIGMGYWFRGRHELLLVAVRGKVSPPEQSKRVASVFTFPRGKHSRKPTEVHGMIEKMLPNATRCEMFARTTRTGWSAWGNEV